MRVSTCVSACASRKTMLVKKSLIHLNGANLFCGVSFNASLGARNIKFKHLDICKKLSWKSYNSAKIYISLHRVVFLAQFIFPASFHLNVSAVLPLQQF